MITKKECQLQFPEIESFEQIWDIAYQEGYDEGYSEAVDAL